MEKSLFERMGGTYKQVGDYLLPGLILSGQEQQSIGIWGQRHARYLKQYHRVRYYNLLTSGKLNSYLADIDKLAEELFSRLVRQMSEKQGITELQKAKLLCGSGCRCECEGVTDATGDTCTCKPD